MSLARLTLMPIAAAAIMYFFRRRRLLILVLGLVTLAVGAGFLRASPLGQPQAFLEGYWLLQPSGRSLLLLSYAASAVLLLGIAFGGLEHAESGALLGGLGLLTGAVTLRPFPLPFLLVSAAMLACTMAPWPQRPSSVGGATLLLPWATVPIPFVLAAFALLQRLELFPQDSIWMSSAAILAVIPVAVLLGLFPFHFSTLVWVKDGISATPTLLWTVKDLVVVYLWALLWREVPAWRTPATVSMLANLGLLTAVAAGAQAALSRTPAVVLACASMASLGVTVQTLALSSSGGSQAAVLLVTRTVAVLLGTTSLAGVRADARSHPSSPLAMRWMVGSLLIAFCAAVLTLTRLANLGGLAEQLSGVSGPLAVSGLRWLAIVAPLGLAVGLVRSGFSLWRDGSMQSARSRTPLFALCAGLLLVMLYVMLRPESLRWLVLGWFSVPTTSNPL